MAFSFIHISDIHLGRPFSDLSKYSFDTELSKLYKTAVNEAFMNCIDFALTNKVDFVLVAGDTFDSDEQDFASKLILKKVLKKLEDNGIKAFLICGNHDCINSYNKNTFDFDDNSDIKIIGLNTEKSGKFIIKNSKNEDIAVLQALSFENSEMRENPLKYFVPFDKEEEKLFKIGLLHCDLDADKDSVYAPCKTSDLKEMGYDYWALGHIHIPSKSSDICYAGTLQGRNTKETGVHGFRYINVENNKIISNELIPSDIIRYEDITVDISGVKDTTSLYSLIYDTIDKTINNIETKVKLYLIRLELKGITDLYSSLDEQFFNTVSEQIQNDFQTKIYISQIYNNAQSKADEEILKSDEGITGEIYRTVQDTENIKIAFDDNEKQFKTLIKNCNFLNEEYEEFKSEIINFSKEYLIGMCSRLYNLERNEDEE
ncbi:DNA repair exonuclease [bacterium]|nr:DNA repair exonuclease [bacterium]